MLLQRRRRFQELKLQRKTLRDANNPFNLDPEYFSKYYRLTPEVALTLINLIENRLLRDQENAVPPYIQVLITLRFLAEGGYQKGFSQDFTHPVSQSTASKFLTPVLEAINSLAERFIVFPNTREERHRVQTNFQQTIRILGVIGIVDRFLVTFVRPSENEEAFYNYRVGTSMNVQIITDSEYIIRNLCICPGSNNDRFIWEHSEANKYMKALRANNNDERPCYILGDSGYTPSPVLLTPVLDAPEGSLAAAYTSEHVRTRSQVKRTIGILSGVWRYINRERKLHYSPQKVAEIIKACAVLHNFRKKHGVADLPNINEALPAHPEIEINGDFQAGIAQRNHIINVHYNHA